MFKLYPSSAAFMWGDMVITEIAQGCLRSTLLRQYVKQGDIPEDKKVMGAQWEDIICERLVNDQPLPFHKELVCKRMVSENVQVSGRCDYVLYHDKHGPIVYECKASSSKYFLKDVIKGGKIKINHLAQVVTYLHFFGVTRGKITTGYFEGTELRDEREFKIEIDGKGNILVDGGMSGFCVHDLLEHQVTAAQVLEKQIVWDRPDKADAKFGSPCTYCDFKATCTAWDCGDLNTTEEFINHAKEASPLR
jgi:hypothetical protein